MNICRKARRAKNAIKKTTQQPIHANNVDEKDIYTVYVVSQTYAKKRGWGGAGAIRSTDKDGVGYCAFKKNDTWPTLYTKEGVFCARAVLDNAAKQKGGNGAPMRDFILHEVGGHEVRGWGHDVDNAVMNANIRPGTTPAQYREDRDVLDDAILSKYKAFRVVLDWHP